MLDNGLKVTGLSGADAPAYHLKADYKLYDVRSGTETESGTLEVWSSGPGVWHRQYTEKKQSVNEWSTSATDQLEQKGAKLNLNALNAQVATPLLDPLSLAAKYKPDLALTGQAGTFDNIVLNCVTVTNAATEAGSLSPDLLFPRYCFDAKDSTLRFATTTTVMTAYSGFKAVGGRQVATKVEVKPYNRLGAELDVTLVEPLGTADQAAVKPSGKTVAFPWAHLASDPPLVLAHMMECEYPMAARDKQELGMAAVPVVISKDGKVKSNGAPSGPPDLAQAAGDCVTNYRFEPFKVNGQPVEVSDTILYNFDGKPYQGLNGTVTIASQAPAKK
uniref:TonB C-terminal domain-containing protein n=1 Tax=mine drainage metagenome TaxID=410659 RepID=E6PWS3_9ZZZZ